MCTMASGRMAGETDQALIFGRMEISIRDSGKMIEEMDKVSNSKFRPQKMG